MAGGHTGHAHRMYRHGHSVVHGLPAHVKIVALVSFVLIVVSTPREAFWAFGAYALLLIAVAMVAHVPAGFILPRMLIELPFVVFALLLPFISGGPETEFLGLTVSESGLLAGWNIIAKGSLGVVASILLAATTEPRDLLVGLQRLRVPPLLVEIASFMVRYADVIGGEMQRMKVARESRGFQGRHLGHLRVIAHSAGALFIRSYERGERVHLAMLSRGYNGALPRLGSATTTGSDWARAVVLPAAALVIAANAWVLL